MATAWHLVGEEKYADSGTLTSGRRIRGRRPAGVHGRANFFLPLRVLRRIFGSEFIARLKQACRSGQLRFFGLLSKHADGQAFERLLDRSVRTDWVVYTKPLFREATIPAPETTALAAPKPPNCGSRAAPQ